MTRSLGHEGAVEEDLGEVVLAVLGTDRAHVDAGLVEIDQHHRQALVARPARAGQQHRSLRQVTERRPHLLPVEAEAVAVGFHAGAQRGEVAAGVGLGERLCPHVVAAEQAAATTRRRGEERSTSSTGTRISRVVNGSGIWMSRSHSVWNIAARKRGSPPSPPALGGHPRRDQPSSNSSACSVARWCGAVFEAGCPVADERLGPRVVAQERGQGLGILRRRAERGGREVSHGHEKYVSAKPCRNSCARG